MRIFTAIVVCLFLQILVEKVLGIFEFSDDWLYKVIVTLFLFLLFVKNSLQYISANPPYKGVLTVFGKRSKKIVKEGWRFFPFHGLVFGYERFPAGQIDHTVTTKSRVSRDDAEVEVEIGISYEVNTLDADGPIKFMNAGNEKGVNKKIGETIEERIKEWLRSKMEGPQTWAEAQEAKEEGTGVILKRMLGNYDIRDNPDGLPKIHSDIPTTILFKHFKLIAVALTEKEKEVWQDQLDALEKNSGLKKKVMEELTKRKGQIDQVRQGRGKFKLSNYGIVIIRLNVVSIAISGVLAEAADKKAKETAEKEAEILETKHMLDLTDLIKEKRPTLSDQEVLEASQLELGKIKKVVQENKITGNVPSLPLIHVGKE